MRQQPGHPVRMAAAGSFLPGNPIPYEDADRVLGEFTGADEAFRTWYARARRTMKQLLGIEHYYYAIDPETRQPTETPSSMAAKAGRRALETAGIDPSEVDLLVYAGATQDHFVTPPTSTIVQQHLGIERCAELSIHSNCTSTYKAIQVAADQIAYGRYRTALVTSANMVSVSNLAESFAQQHLTKAQAMLRWFLCDGGGAVVLTRGEGPGFSVVDTFTESLGTKHPPHMCAPFGSAHNPITAVAQGLHHVGQDFTQVSQIGPAFFVDGFIRFAEQLGIDVSDERVLERIPHVLVNVPSDHLVETALEDWSGRVRFPVEKLKERYYSTVANRGYTGPAAVLITLDELMRKHTLRDGDCVMSLVTESSKWMNAGFLLRYHA
jgi:3-oxoacyl-[acyl-carrier-protein] synthase III